MLSRRRLLWTTAAAALTSTAVSAVARAQEHAPVTRVLSVDGGGIRGIAAAQMIVRLDEELSKNGAGVVDTFDVFAGTSTGAIIAAALSVSKLIGDRITLPAELPALYRRHAEEIFAPRSWAPVPLSLMRARHENRGLLAVLDRYFGDLRLADVPKNLLCTTYQLQSTDDSDRPSPRPLVIRAGPVWRDSLGPDWLDLRLADVVLASASAPTYFEPSHFRKTDLEHMLNVDGGLFANNPSLHAYAAAQGLTRRVQVISIGCGEAENVRFNTNVADWGAWEWISPGNHTPLIDSLMRGQSESVDALMAQFAEHSTELDYHRFDFPIPEHVGSVNMTEHGMNSVHLPYLNALTSLAETRMRRDDVLAAVQTLRSN